MICGKFLAVLFVLCLSLVGLLSCRSEDSIIDKSKYRKALLTVCDGLVPHRKEACVEDHFIRETELYCASRDIPQKDCDLIETKVRSKLSDYAAEIEAESK